MRTNTPQELIDGVPGHPVDPSASPSFPVETNIDVEDAEARAVTARELRRCISAIGYCNPEPADLGEFSNEMIAMARALIPEIERVAQLRLEADEATETLTAAVQFAVDYLDTCALIDFVESLTDPMAAAFGPEARAFGHEARG